MDPSSAQIVFMSLLERSSNDLIRHVLGFLLMVTVVLISGMLAKIAQELARLILGWVRWERQCERWGWTRVLAKFRSDWSPTALLLEVLFWWLVVTGSMLGFQYLDMPWLTHLGRGYFDLIPNLLKAGLVLAFALWIARGAAAVGRWVLPRELAGLVGALLQLLALGLGLESALLLLGFERTWVDPALLLLLAGGVLAVIVAWSLDRRAFGRRRVRIESKEGR